MGLGARSELQLVGLGFGVQGFGVWGFGFLGFWVLGFWGELLQ